MDETLVPLTVAIATTILAAVVLKAALYFMDDWSWRRRLHRSGGRDPA